MASELFNQLLGQALRSEHATIQHAELLWHRYELHDLPRCGRIVEDLHDCDDLFDDAMEPLVQEYRHPGRPYEVVYAGVITPDHPLYKQIMQAMSELPPPEPPP